MRAFIFILLLLSINCFATNVAKFPKLTFVGKRIVNLGYVKEGKVIEQKILFTNNGDSPLIIKGITKSCNCANAILKESKINPKDTSSLSIIIETKGKVGLNVVDVILNTNTQQKEHIIKVLMEVVK